MYNGPDGHIITYPVANGTLLNILVVMTDYCDWKAKDGKMTARTTKAEAVEFFKDWKHPAVRAIVNELLPEVLDKWGVFDMMKDPAERYNKARVVLAGDAAHAAGPHLGGGAGMGIEDALVLATALEVVNSRLEGEREKDKERLCENALEAYNKVRYERTQWLIRATREACALFHLKPPEVPNKQHNDMFGKEVSERFHTIWDEDVEGMVQETRRLLEAEQ
jgi:salicylate hydroxylase